MKDYWDNTVRSRNVIISFCVLAIINVMSIALELYQNMVLKGYELGDYSVEDVEQLDTYTAIMAFVQIAAIIVVIVVFIMWFRRAYENLIRMNVPMEHSGNGAIWGYFIPFVNWVRPVTTMKEVYTKTQQTLKNHNQSIAVDDNLNFITAWWVFYIINGVIGNIASRMMTSADTIESFVQANNVYILADTWDLFSIALAVFVVQKVSKVEAILNETDTSTSIIDMIGVSEVE